MIIAPIFIMQLIHVRVYGTCEYQPLHYEEINFSTSRKGIMNDLDVSHDGKGFEKEPYPAQIGSFPKPFWRNG